MSNPVAVLRDMAVDDQDYQALVFVCPGCLAQDAGSGLHMLPVNTAHKAPQWDFDGDLGAPTLSPSILTRYDQAGVPLVCHSYLRAGVFEFLGDCTHELAGQSVPMVPLPDWFLQ